MNSRKDTICVERDRYIFIKQITDADFPRNRLIIYKVTKYPPTLLIGGMSYGDPAMLATTLRYDRFKDNDAF